MMQYILSEEEFKNLTTARELETKLNQESLQKLCTKIACEMPIKFWNREEATPWGCPLEEIENGGPGMEYCDECPVQSICPNKFKSWSQ